MQETLRPDSVPLAASAAVAPPAASPDRSTGSGTGGNRSTGDKGSISSTSSVGIIGSTGGADHAARLDQPLPDAVAGRGHGFLTAYRRWPVFSTRWVLGRLKVWGSIALAALALVGLQMLDMPAQDLPVGGIVHFGAQLLLPLLVGPWLGHWVRRRHWPAAREDAALAVAMLLLVASMFAFHLWVAEPLKQGMAQALGQIDEQGQRRKVMMSFGVMVSTPEDKPHDKANKGLPSELTTANRIVNGVSAALVTLVLGGAVGLVGRRRERAGLAALAQERELARERAQRHEAQMRLSVLAAQVEPHFLFNTLAGVRSAIATDPSRASDMIDRLVEYLRAAIPRLRSEGADDTTGLAQATLASQLEIVQAYLALMATRMPRLAWHIDVPADLMALPCPPLMLISLAENAVKHGVEPKPGPVRVWVSARRGAGGTLDIAVADDGAGFGSQAAGSGLGLVNIRERLAQMYAGRASLNLRARAEGGVAATLSLPLDAR